MNPMAELSQLLGTEMPDLWCPPLQTIDPLPKMKIRLSQKQQAQLESSRSKIQNLKRNRSTSKSTSRCRVKKTKSSLDSMKTSSQTDAVSNDNSSRTCPQLTIAVKSQGLINSVNIPSVDQLPQTMTTDINISSENQFDELFHSLNPPPTQILVTPISTTLSPQLTNMQELVNIVYQQAVVPHINSINECESRLRLVMFEKFAIPMIKNVIDRELSLYHYNPTFMQLHDIVRLGFKEVGLISH
jgi:hypothetical protein